MSTPVPPPPVVPPPPPGPPPAFSPPPPTTPAGPGRAEIERMLSTPATGLMVTGGLIVLGNIIGLLMKVLGVGMSGMEGLGGMDDMKWLAPLMSGTIAIISAIIGLGIGGFVVWGAMQMKQLHGYVLSIVTCVLPMIPCFSSCCCLLGLAFGIWGLVLLLKPEVKAAFS